MILNIVTDKPEMVRENIEFLFGKSWVVSAPDRVAQTIYEFNLTPRDGDQIMSVENLLELGISPYNIRIR